MSQERELSGVFRGTAVCVGVWVYKGTVFWNCCLSQSKQDNVWKLLSRGVGNKTKCKAAGWICSEWQNLGESEYKVLPLTAGLN